VTGFLFTDDKRRYLHNLLGIPWVNESMAGATETGRPKMLTIFVILYLFVSRGTSGTPEERNNT
jgi:hypothetical protein